MVELFNVRSSCTIRLWKSAQTDDLCSHPCSINAKLTLKCSAFLYHTTDATEKPTAIPTMITAVPTTSPTVSCHGSCSYCYYKNIYPNTNTLTPVKIQSVW